jgi:hypothetical protein
MFLHRYSKSFDDTGNLATLPKISLGLGVSGYRERWRSSDLSVGEITGNWVDAISGSVLNNVGEPMVEVNSGGIKEVRVDGVNDALDLPTGIWYNGDQVYTNIPESITFLMNVPALPASGQIKGIANFGGGCLEINQATGKFRVWANGSPVDGGSGSGTGNYEHPTVVDTSKYYVITISGVNDSNSGWEITVNKEHFAWPDTRTKRGLYDLYLGRGTSTNYFRSNTVEILAFDRVLTRTEKESLYDGFKLNYPELNI